MSDVPMAPIPLSRRMSRMTTSAVREILKVASRSDILSFAGGLPAPEFFPIEAIAAAHAKVLADEGRSALQYSITEGEPALRDWLAQRLQRRGMRVSVEQVLITNGAQQGIELMGKALLDDGDAVAIENPSYLAALQTFGGYEAELMLVDSDADGMQVDQLAEQMRTTRPKVIYLVPDFHNPKGTTLSLARREQLVALAQQYRVPIIEDDPYGELRFSGDFPPPLAALDDQGLVTYLGTFSKTLAPGMRLGYTVAPPALVKPLTIAKQASDLHTATLAQRAVATLLQTFDYEGHLATLRAGYGERCRAMMAGLSEHFPAGTTWNQPDGGLFLWVRLPEGVTGERLFEEAIAERVAFVPGSAFFAARPDPRYVRLNFSNRDVAMITEGMARLGAALRRCLS